MGDQYKKTGHVEVLVKHEGMEALVDEGIAPLVLELWKAGVPTEESCQGESGFAALYLPRGWVMERLLRLLQLGAARLHTKESADLFDRAIGFQVPEDAWDWTAVPSVLDATGKAEFFYCVSIPVRDIELATICVREGRERIDKEDTVKIYRLSLPVFKQGDDLGHQIHTQPTLKEAFLAQAECYEEAAEICKRMAGVAAEVPDLEVQADTHFIGIEGPEDRLDALAREGILDVEEFDEDGDPVEREEDAPEGEEEVDAPTDSRSVD